MATKTGTANNDLIKGTNLADTLSGLAGHDSLYGYEGNDTLDGGAGDDFLSGGIGADILIGGSGYNDLSGGGGNDIFKMSNRVGADFSDDLIYDMADGDLIDLSAWGVSDFSQVQALLGVNVYGATLNADYNGKNHVISWLGVAPWQFEFDDFVYSNAAGGTQTGTANSDTLFGTRFVDTLNGGAGNDTLLGGVGADTLNGGAGHDDLIGGTGRDVMSGAAGLDYFIFDSAAETGIGAGVRDLITDFTRGQDRIDLCDIDAKSTVAGNQAFTWIGTGAFTAAGQLRYMQVGGDTIIQGSTDGDTAAEFEIQLTGLHALTASDFFL